MVIEFSCPHCGRELKLKDEAAGKRGRCPGCRNVITVPQPSVPPNACPDCGNTLPEGAVICVKCGLNLKTGQKLQTVFEEPEPEEENDQVEPSGG